MQVQNNKEEVPFAHYEEKFASLDPQEAAARCGVPFENGRFTVTLLGTAYQIAWPKYAISSEDEAAFALKSLPCQTFLLRFLLEGRAAEELHAHEEDVAQALSEICRANHMTMEELQPYYDDAFAAAVEYSILLAKVTKRIRESAVMDA